MPRCYTFGVLTRSGVAKCLRRSLATVRRLEGVELFPHRDLRGVHWFDEAEVRDVQRRIARGAVDAARGSWLDRPRRLSRSQVPAAAPRADLTQVVVELERENTDLRKTVHELEEKLADVCEALDDLVG